jgi:hypothetical protein
VNEMMYFIIWVVVVLLLILLLNILDEFDIILFEEADPFRYMFILFWPITIPFCVVFAIIYFIGLSIQSTIIKQIKKIQTKRSSSKVKLK